MNNQQLEIEVLNDLVKINNDRVEGYKHAIEELKEGSGLKTVFETFIHESEKYKNELQKKIEERGGVASKDATVPGKIYRMWMDTKTTFTGGSKKSVLELCEFGEDAAQTAYKTALEEGKNIEPALLSLIADQKQALKRSHDTIKQYRDSEKDN